MDLHFYSSNDYLCHALCSGSLTHFCFCCYFPSAVLLPCLFVWGIEFLETGLAPTHYVQRITLNTSFASSAEITGICHHIWLDSFCCCLTKIAIVFLSSFLKIAFKMRHLSEDSAGREPAFG